MKEGKIDASLLNLPFNFLAQEAGLSVLEDPRRVIGAYQSMGGFVQRAWAEQNRDTLVHYLAAFVEGLRWSMDPANQDAAIALLAARMQLAPNIAEQCYAQILDPITGFTKDAMLDHVGMRKVLELRGNFASTPPVEIPTPDRYLDERYHCSALAILQKDVSAESAA